MDSDLLGSLGRKKVTSPRNKPGKDSDMQDKHNDVRRRTSSGSLHRKGSVTPFSGRSTWSFQSGEHNVDSF